jgi:hypothetical protein
MGDRKAAEYVAQYRTGEGPEALAGTVDQIVATLSERRELGLGYSIHNFPESAIDRSGVELFEREVLPALGG